MAVCLEASSCSNRMVVVIVVIGVFRLNGGIL